MDSRLEAAPRFIVLTREVLFFCFFVFFVNAFHSCIPQLPPEAPGRVCEPQGEHRLPYAGGEANSSTLGPMKLPAENWNRESVREFS